MKMQMRKVLVLSAVDDQPVGFEVEFFHEALDGGKQVREKGGVGRVKVCQCLNLPLWDDEQVNLVTGRGVMESDQARGLAEAFDGEEETHAGEEKADQEGYKSKVEKLF